MLFISVRYHNFVGKCVTDLYMCICLILTYRNTGRNTGRISFKYKLLLL